MAGTVFNAGDIIGKTLIANKQLDVWNDVASRGKKIGVVLKGNSCGVVDSWITDRKDGTIYWAFKSPLGPDYYIAHQAGSFNVSALREQGVITTEEKIQEEKEKNQEWWERAIKGLGKIVIPVAIIYGVATVLKSTKNG